MGSLGPVLPARLGHAGDVAIVRGLAQADPAEAELAVVAARAPATTAAVVFTGFELGLAALLHLHRSLSHRNPPRRQRCRPRRSRSRRHPRPPRRPQARAWRTPRGSPLSTAPGRPARPLPANAPPPCASPPPLRPPPPRRDFPAGPLWRKA